MTRDQAQELAKNGARLTALLGCAIAQRDADVLAAQNKHAALINKLSDDITAIKADLQKWAVEQRKAQFGEKQSLEFPAAVLSFRLGNRQLDLLAKWDWKKVLKAMVRWKNYLRVKVEINKQKLLADSAGARPKLKADRLATVGVRVIQEEVFDVEFRAAPDTLKGAAAA